MSFLGWSGWYNYRDKRTEGGTVHRHIDPVWMEDTVTVHFNIIARKPKGGGVTIIDGEPWDVEDTDLLSYIVSDAEHEVDEVGQEEE